VLPLSSLRFSHGCSPRLLPQMASPPFASRAQRAEAGCRICPFPTLRTLFPCSYNFLPFDLPMNGRISPPGVLLSPSLRRIGAKNLQALSFLHLPLFATLETPGRNICFPFLAAPAV